jgi:hypothetical protein
MELFLPPPAGVNTSTGVWEAKQRKEIKKPESAFPSRSKVLTRLVGPLGSSGSHSRLFQEENL